MEVPLALIISFILFSLTLSVLKIITFPGVTAQTSNDLISDVCRKTRYPTLCLRVLRSNRRACKASSPLELGEVSMDLSKSRAQATRNTINMLSLRARDRELKRRLKSCVISYDSAMYYIKIATHYWKSGDFANVAAYIAAAVNEPISCQQNFARAAPAEPAYLREGNNKLESLCRVVLIISNQLSGRKFSPLEGHSLHTQKTLRVANLAQPYRARSS